MGAPGVGSLHTPLPGVIRRPEKTRVSGVCIMRTNRLTIIPLVLSSLQNDLVCGGGGGAG